VGLDLPDAVHVGLQGDRDPAVHHLLQPFHDAGRGVGPGRVLDGEPTLGGVLEVALLVPVLEPAAGLGVDVLHAGLEVDHVLVVAFDVEHLLPLQPGAALDGGDGVLQLELLVTQQVEAVHVEGVDQVDLGGHTPADVHAGGDAQESADFLVDGHQFVLVDRGQVYRKVCLILLLVVLLIEGDQFLATVHLHWHYRLEELGEPLALLGVSELEVNTFSECLHRRTEHVCVVFED